MRILHPAPSFVAGRDPDPPAVPRHPLFYAALAFSTGILLGSRVWRPLTWWLVAALIFAASTLFFARRRPRFAPFIALATMVLAGALMLQLRTSNESGGGEILPYTDGREVLITAHVTGEGLIREDSMGGTRQSVELETDEIADGGARVQVSSGIRVNFYARLGATPAQHSFGYGQRVRFLAKLHQPRNFGNPGAFDYKGYLADRGIFALGSAKAEEVEILRGPSGSRTRMCRSLVHRSVLEKIHSLWPPQQAALMDAMVVGEDSFLEADTRIDFQRSGTYHILVVSGMNVGILATVVFWTLRRFRMSDVLASLVTVTLCIAYAFLCDTGSPVWRSALMLSIYLGVRLLYRGRSPLNAIGGAALIILIYNPTELLGASFQLTFLAVIAIAGIGVPLLERSSTPFMHGLRNIDSVTYDPTLPARVTQLRLDLRLLGSKVGLLLGGRFWPRALTAVLRATISAYEVLLISCLMQVALALPMAFYFHRVTIVGLPANSIAVPLTGILMPATAAAVVLAYISPVLASLPAGIAGWCLQGITGTIGVLTHWRVADWRIPTPTITLCAIASFGLVLAIILARRRSFAVAASGTLVLAAAALWIAFFPSPPRVQPGMLEMTAIDVGQGDSTLLITPEGRTLLVDAGGLIGPWASQFDIGEQVVSPYLWARGIARLDAVAITHGHSDHIGGMHSVLANFRPRELWVGVLPKTPAFARLMRQAADLGIRVVVHRSGDDFDFGGAQVRILAPPPDQQALTQARNQDSMAMTLRVGNTAVFLEGDAEKKAERGIAEQHPRADLLKVAHNGSATSTSAEILSEVRPRFAVISVGAHNYFGHPRLETLERLGDARIVTYRTDLNGAVTFYLDGEKITPRPAALR